MCWSTDRRAGRLAAAAAAAWMIAVPAWAQVPDNRGLELDPDDPLSPAYGGSLQERERQRLEEARETGGSFVPTAHGEIERPEDPAPEVVEEAEPERPEVAADPEPVRETWEAPAVESLAVPEMLDALIEAWNAPPAIVRVRYPSREPAPDGTGAAPPASPEGRPVTAVAAAAATAVPGLAAVRPGDGVYARAVYAIDSDYPGPVFLEVLEPPLAGARLTGAFTRAGERLVLRVTAIEHRGVRAAVPDRALWWDVVDALFDAGAFEAAARAQRYAVPVLSDLLPAVRGPAVQALVGEAVYGAGGETVTAAFVRVLTSLSGSWPILFRPTAFDVAGARVAAVDLSEVAPTGSAEADRQTAAMYMLARHALTRDWWIGEESLAGVPERYRAWHAERLRRLRETPKRLAYDEFHRTGRAPAVRAQVERDVREARKLRVRLALVSQRIEDFGPALVELANRYWVLGAGGKTAEIEALGALFGMSETLKEAVRFGLSGPGGDGAPALLIASDARGRFEQIVVNTPGPVELWALTTAPADVALRSRVYRLMAPPAARLALARAFPRGTARGHIEDERRRLEHGGAGAAAEEDVLDTIADRVAAGEAA